MNIKKAIIHGVKKLSKFDNPKLETEVLLSFIIKKDRIFLKIHQEYILNNSEISLYKKFLMKRVKNIPISYILGYKNWADLKIIVNRNVLIPRDETEILVYKIIEDLNNINYKNKINILDIGTGSGCIALYLNSKLKYIETTTCLDISEKALKVAKQNFKKQNLNATFIKSNLLENIPDNSYFDLIIANLPYVPIHTNISQDLSYEPSIALFSGNDGLNHIRDLYNQIELKKIKFKNLWLEFLPIQKKIIKDIFNKYKIKFYKDTGGDVFFARIYI
jgi:release factor glutamine methyltransferase